MGEPLLTAADAERQLGIPASRIRQWKRRRRLFPAGIILGDPAYRPEELRKLANLPRSGR